jgi:hypothetical protein
MIGQFPPTPLPAYPYVPEVCKDQVALPPSLLHQSFDHLDVPFWQLVVPSAGNDPAEVFNAGPARIANEVFTGDVSAKELADPAKHFPFAASIG